MYKEGRYPILYIAHSGGYFAGRDYALSWVKKLLIERYVIHELP